MIAVPGGTGPARKCNCPGSPLCVHDTPGEQRLAEAIFGTRPADPDQPCYHPEFDAVVQVGRIGEDDPGNPMPGMPTAFVAEVMIKCKPCGEQFVFDGVPAGLSFDAPATSLDGRELRAPCRPESLPPRHRRGLAGPTGVHIEIGLDGG